MYKTASPPQFTTPKSPSAPSDRGKEEKRTTTTVHYQARARKKENRYVGTWKRNSPIQTGVTIPTDPNHTISSAINSFPVVVSPVSSALMV